MYKCGYTHIYIHYFDGFDSFIEFCVCMYACIYIYTLQLCSGLLHRAGMATGGPGFRKCKFINVYIYIIINLYSDVLMKHNLCYIYTHSYVCVNKYICMYIYIYIRNTTSNSLWELNN
jgi:hypothetical protein